MHLYAQRCVVRTTVESIGHMATAATRDKGNTPAGFAFSGATPSQLLSRMTGNYAKLMGSLAYSYSEPPTAPVCR